MGPFTNVQLSDGALIQFAEPPVDEIQPQHYAFRVTDDLFDVVVKRLSVGEIMYWADPHQTQKRQINHHHDGRGVYFKDPAGHLIEVLTKPYLPQSAFDEFRLSDGLKSRRCVRVAIAIPHEALTRDHLGYLKQGNRLMPITLLCCHLLSILGATKNV
ncbi:hypothetical protein BJI47_00865 [Rhodococcus sp. 1168]|nr:hypothetical protein BJI47_00865 [Rhodococcus sp. 1168]